MRKFLTVLSDAKCPGVTSEDNVETSVSVYCEAGMLQKCPYKVTISMKTLLFTNLSHFFLNSYTKEGVSNPVFKIQTWRHGGSEIE